MKFKEIIASFGERSNLIYIGGDSVLFCFFFCFDIKETSNFMEMENYFVKKCMLVSISFQAFLNLIY